MSIECGATDTNGDATSVLKDVSSHWVRVVLTIGIGFIVPRLMHAHLEMEAYGTWEIIISLTGFLRLLALGTPMASVRAVAEHSGKGQSDALNRAISSSAAILITIGGLILIAGGILFGAFELIYVPDKVPDTLRNPARIAFGLIVFQVAAAFICQFPFSILGGFRQFVRQNSLKVVAMSIRVALLSCVLLVHASLIWLAIAEIATLLFEFALPWCWIRRHLPQVQPRVNLIDRGHIRRIMTFGGYVLLLNMGIRLSFQTDALVLGAFMTSAAIVHYARANTLIIYLVELLVAVGEVIMPTVSAMRASEDKTHLRTIFLRWSKITMGMSLVAAIYISTAGPQFVGWWMNGDLSFVEPATRILPVLACSTVIFMPARAVALPLLLGLDRPRGATVGFLVAGVANLGLSIALVRPYGLFGVAIATAVPNTIYALCVIQMACRASGQSLSGWFLYVIPKSIVGGTIVWFAVTRLMPFFDLSSLPGLVLMGLTTVVLFGITWGVVVYRNDPHIDLSALLSRLKIKK